MNSRALLLASLCLGLTVFPGARAYGACTIGGTPGSPGAETGDVLARLLARESACPRDVHELRALLKRAGAQLTPTLVGNRGFHNPGAGSFSLFEIVTGNLREARLALERGDLFFGHFTAPGTGRTLVLGQQPLAGSLMVELIAWDERKGMFNFYEVIGDGQQGRWFYRGDSGDILADTAKLFRQAGPQYGTKLRCSGCHVGGGPIMKELAAPHNDWWRVERRLPLDDWQPDAALAEILSTVVDASELAQSALAGLQRLDGSAQFRALSQRRSLQEKVRPLLCPMELNLESDVEPLESPAKAVRIPAAFFASSELLTEAVPVSREAYREALVKNKASFPETSRRDGDHGWLTPVKATSDLRAIGRLISDGVIDEEFAADVLAVDLTNPVFSTSRCRLLRLVPATETATWQAAFREALQTSSDPAGAELLANLTDPARTRAFHRQRAEAIAGACRERSRNAEAVSSLYGLLAVRRAEAFASPISSNPRGQILEPGFRVIFPVVKPAAKAGSLRLTDDCMVTSIE